MEFTISAMIELFILVSDLVFFLILLHAEKKNPSKIVVWALVFLLLPLLGFILYLFIGQTFYSRRTFRVKALKDNEFKEMIDYDRTVADREEVPEYRRIAKTMQIFGSIGYTVNNTVRLFTLG